MSHFTKSQLKNDRYWTDAGIRNFLGEPDERGDNPFANSRPLCLFSRERVLEIESSVKFQEWLKQSLKRRKKNL